MAALYLAYITVFRNIYIYIIYMYVVGITVVTCTAIHKQSDDVQGDE